MGDKRFQGAPFGTQKSRFDVAGIHPKSKTPGTFTQVSYDKKSMKSLGRSLGPGSYNIDNGDFSSKAVQERASGPGWERAFEISQAARMPHLLYREVWEEKQLQKQRLGPGTYLIPDCFNELSKKPASTHGICQTRAQRFGYVGKSETPGPGSYGIGGVPHAAIEEKQRKSSSTTGMLDSGASSKRQLPEVGSALCPGQYNMKSFTDHMSERVISKRGPYDLFTGDRNAPMMVGHLAAPSLVNLGPGEYQIKSFIEELQDDNKKRYGKFGKVARETSKPVERIHCCTLSQWPRKESEPGPGQYDIKAQLKSSPVKRPPFGSSSARSDRQARKFFLGNTNPVGPGRYNTAQDRTRSKHSSTHRSSFNSNTKRWDPERDKFLMERIRAKDVPLKDRDFLVPLSAN